MGEIDLPPILETGNTLTFRDNFVDGPNLEFWTLKRADVARVAPVKWEGRTALKISVEPGDRKEVDQRYVSTERTEISEKPDVMVSEGRVCTYGVSIFIPTDISVSSNRLVISQFKQETGGKESPFISWRYIDGKLIFLVTNSQDRIRFTSTNKDLRGGWYNLETKYRISKGEGVAVATLDGEVVADYTGSMGVDRKKGKVYYKMGLYRDAIREGQTIYFSDFYRTISD